MGMIKELGRLLRFLNCGDLKITPFVVTDRERTEPMYEVSISEEYRTVRLQAVKDGVFRDTLYLEYTDREVTCKRVFENLSSGMLKL